MHKQVEKGYLHLVRWPATAHYYQAADAGRHCYQRAILHGSGARMYPCSGSLCCQPVTIANALQGPGELMAEDFVQFLQRLVSEYYRLLNCPDACPPTTTLVLTLSDVPCRAGSARKLGDVLVKLLNERCAKPTATGAGGGVTVTAGEAGLVRNKAAAPPAGAGGGDGGGDDGAKQRDTGLVDAGTCC